MDPQTIFIAWCLIIVQCHATCKDSGNGDMECSLAADINASGVQLAWTKLRIVNNKFESLLPDAFLNVPNISELVFIHSVNAFKYNAFKDLKRLDKLHFFNCDIMEIKSGMLTHLSISEFIIYRSNVRSLAVRSFDHLPNLKTVTINRNTISYIAADVFSYTNIEHLYLNENGIRTIETEAFFGMEKLKTLALERNHLTSFTPALFIGESSPLLATLWLARNNITKITTDSFINFPQLRVLLLHINPLRRIEENSFNGLQNLRYMDLSNTNLDLISPKVLPTQGLALLETLFLQNSRLTYLSKDIIAKLPRLKHITIGGNPWQCVCYLKLRKSLEKNDIEILCDEQYFDGSRPICIYPETNPNSCEYKTEKTKDLFDQFIEATQDYVKFPPLCKLDCVNNTACYSHYFDLMEYK